MYRGGNQGTKWSKNKAFHYFGDMSQKKLTIVIVCGAVLVIALILVIVRLTPASNQQSTRSETYKKIAGGAGLKATIGYDAHCDKQPCKPTYDFNVYLLNEDGRQVAVVQPSKDGIVHAALPEGNYVLLVGKRFAKDGVFPQEPATLKNGQELELKLHYKEEVL